MVRWLLLASCCLLVAAPAAAQQFHKCVQPNGHVVYSRRSCTEGAQASTVDTSQAVRAGEKAAAAIPVATDTQGSTDAAALAARLGIEAACARERESVVKRFRPRFEEIDHQLTDRGRSDPALAQRLASDRADIEREQAREFKLAEKRCNDPSQAAPSSPPGRSAATGPTSWKCLAENGEVFFRHDECPTSIRIRQASGTSSAVLLSLSVEVSRIPRTEACAEIASPDAWSRRGRERDQFPPEDPQAVDPCRQ